MSSDRKLDLSSSKEYLIKMYFITYNVISFIQRDGLWGTTAYKCGVRDSKTARQDGALYLKYKYF